MKKPFKNIVQPSIVAALLCLYAVSCKKDDPKPTLLATIATTAPSAITESSASTGGNITSDGGSTVTEAGIVYSTVKPAPTTGDEKKTSATLTGAFTINLTGLNSGTNYFVRAYAINSVGTSYGEPVILTTGNLAPVAKNVTVTGTKAVDQKLTATYAYSDAENNAESGTTFKWYRANDAAGAGEVAIDGATKTDYTLVTADVGKFLRIGVTPKAAAGTSTGAEVKSAFAGPIDAKANNAPTAAITAISGSVNVFETLTASYAFSDVENDVESGTTFQWYRANDASGAGEAAIDGATAISYELVPTDGNKFIRIGVIPRAATGTTIGVEIKSSFSGPVPPATVAFTYNGSTVTYGIIKSSVTGKRWLDRNIGASRVAQAFDDYQAYGDLFQWGRRADGHQLITWSTSTVGTPVNTGVRTTQSTGDDPGHSDFITPKNGQPFDWRTTPNNTLWGGPDYTNNPCPSGWHVPTEAEWTAENLSKPVDAFEKLKLTIPGTRRFTDGDFFATGSYGWYWTSSVLNEGGLNTSLRAAFDAAIPFETAGAQRSYAMACRCTKNN